MARLVWGVFLLLVGAGILIFNKPYTAWMVRYVPSGPTMFIPPRVLAIILGSILCIAGISALVASH